MAKTRSADALRQPRRTLLVTDLDGTLLRSDRTLGSYTVETLNAFLARGGLLTYATARAFATAAEVTADLNFTLPVVTYGGAVTVDPGTGRARPARMLSPDTVRGIIELTDHSATLAPIMFAMVAGRDRVCWRTSRPTAGTEAYLWRRRHDPRLLALDHWSEIDLDAVFYVSIIGSEAELADVHEPIAALDGHVVVSQDNYAPSQWWLEVSASDATKGIATALLAAELGVDEVICFGDNHNDLPLFAIATRSLAVGNAAPTVRRAATEVIGTNDDEGVAHWIADYLASRPVVAHA